MPVPPQLHVPTSHTLGDALSTLAWPGGGTRGDQLSSVLVDGVAVGARVRSWPYPTTGLRKVRVHWTEFTPSVERRALVYWGEVETPLV